MPWGTLGGQGVIYAADFNFPSCRDKEEKSPEQRDRSPLRNDNDTKPKEKEEEEGRREEEIREERREKGREDESREGRRKRNEEEEENFEERREKGREDEGREGRRRKSEEKEEEGSDERLERSKGEGEGERRQQRPAGGQTVTERRRRELALAAQAMFSRRADTDAVNAARARYLARRQTRAGPIVEDDSD